MIRLIHLFPDVHVQGQPRIPAGHIEIHFSARADALAYILDQVQAGVERGIGVLLTPARGEHRLPTLTMEGETVRPITEEQSLAVQRRAAHARRHP